MNVDIRELPSLLGTEVAIHIQTGMCSFEGMYIFIRGTLERYGNRYVVSNRIKDHTGSSEIMFNAENIGKITGGNSDGIHVLWFNEIEKAD